MSKRKLLFVIFLTILLGLICTILIYVEKSHERMTDTETIFMDSEEIETQREEVSEIEEYKTQAEEISEIEEYETQFVETESEMTDAEPIEVSDETFVRVKTYIPDIEVELKYAGTDNFTRQKIYEFTDAYLRYGTVKKLMQVQETLREQELSLKIWDAFRPTSAQFLLWEVCPDSTYVANPHKGFSSHSRGNTIDITLVDASGNELIMPTGFDDFSTLADRDYSDCTEEAKKNALLLEKLMIENGFKAYSGEWWHFTDKDSYSVDELFSCP